jgi:hypothetical protein
MQWVRLRGARLSEWTAGTGAVARLPWDHSRLVADGFARAYPPAKYGSVGLPMTTKSRVSWSRC